MSITALEFEARYAENAGIPVAVLREWRVVVPCDCDWEGCEGWSSMPVDLFKDKEFLRMRGVPDDWKWPPE